ncbi:MAG: biotin/lipoyl-binding protein, partial [Bacteroidota bacterium]
MRRFVIAGAVAVIAALGGIFLIFRSGSPNLDERSDTASTALITTNSPREIVFPVEVAVARRGDLIKRLSTTGVVRAKREVDIISRIAGEVLEVSIYNGKFVRTGDVLVKLDDREYWIAFEHTRTMLLAAQIEYKSMGSSPVSEQMDSVEVRKHIEEAERKYKEAQRELQAGTMTRDEFARAKRDYETDIA